MPIVGTPEPDLTQLEAETETTTGKTMPAGGEMLPEGKIDSSWDRTEPLITAERLRSQHLFGIPLVSAIKDPITGRYAVMTDELINDMIVQAVSLAEADTGMNIFATSIVERVEYDYNLFKQLGYMQLKSRPVSSIESVEVVTANEESVMTIPLSWIDTSYITRGQLNIVPLTLITSGVATTPGTTSQGAGVSFLLAILGQRTNIPAFFSVTLTSGWADNRIPRIVNQLIGVVAAMEVLSMLGATYARSSSHSLGVDGLSQSVAGLGPALFQSRLEDLQLKRKSLIAKVKRIGGLLLFSSNV